MVLIHGYSIVAAVAVVAVVVAFVVDVVAVVAVADFAVELLLLFRHI